MTQKEQMLNELPYKPWLDGLLEEKIKTKELLFKYNSNDPEYTKLKDELIKQILGKTGDVINIEQPFSCDYGRNIEVGNNFYSNYNLIIWIECNVVINPGVKIGHNSVIGSGAVVTRDTPENAIAVGSPCRVLRKITDNDRKYYYKDREFDVSDY